MDAADRERENLLRGWISQSAGVMRILSQIRSLALPDAQLFAGAIYQTAWNGLTGRAADYGIKDFDVGYFDPDTSWDAEDAVIRRFALGLSEGLAARAEVRNQARVHLWFPARFGAAYAPLQNTSEALKRYLSPAFSVGAWMDDADEIHITAPFGLADCFSMRLRPNSGSLTPHRFLSNALKLQARWPELEIESQVQCAQETDASGA